jgi:pimeloyl-ACP methyl ester carboxylesterase
VVYDQRGTGFSSPLLCGPTEAAIGAAAELLPERADDIREIEGDEVGARVLNYGLCGLFYESVGVDLTQFNSIASAQDMASLMTALGYDQYNLYGTSYGTKLALVAVRETPDRVRTIVIDGIVALTTSPMGTSVIEFDEQYTHIFEQCAQEPACNEAYPNLPERFTALLDELAENPIVLDEPIVPTGFLVTLLEFVDPSLAEEGFDTIDIAFMRALTQINNLSYNHLLGDDYSIAGQIPRLVLALEEGDIEYVRSLFQMSDLPGTAPVEEVTVIEDEQTVFPDNEFIAASIETLLTEAETAVSDAATPEEQWVALMVDNLNQRLTAGEAQPEIVRDMIELSGLPYRGLDKQVLIDHATEYLPEDVATEANAIVEPMTDEDVRATMWHIYEIAAAMSFGGEDVAGLHYGYLFAVNCPEDVDLRTAAVVEEALAAAAYPQLAEAGSESWQLYEIACGFYPDADIDASFIEPVVSDVPALLLQGSLDVQTPPSEARATASTLENGVFVLFESEGHVVGGKDAQCPGAISTQFLNNPSGEIDTSCADAFVLNFELP